MSDMKIIVKKEYTMTVSEEEWEAMKLALDEYALDRKKTAEKILLLARTGSRREQGERIMEEASLANNLLTRMDMVSK